MGTLKIGYNLERWQTIMLNQRSRKRSSATLVKLVRKNI